MLKTRSWSVFPCWTSRVRVPSPAPRFLRISRLQAQFFSRGRGTRKVTVDWTIEFARVLHGSSPSAAFSFLSGKGSDPTVRSRMAFAHYKGQAEKARFRRGSPGFTSSGPHPSIPWSRERNRTPATSSCVRSTPRFWVFFPNQVIPADLARAMVDVAIRRTGKTAGLVLEKRFAR